MAMVSAQTEQAKQSPGGELVTVFVTHEIAARANDADVKEGDVLKVNLAVTDYQCDGLYAVVIDGRECIRRIQAHLLEGLRVFGSLDACNAEPWDVSRMQVLGRVTARAELRFP